MRNKNKLAKLYKISKLLRKKIVEISFNAKAHHIGSELSCIDILVALYFDFMKLNINKKNDINRDYFILSKGHAALALYIVLMKKGFFSENYLKSQYLTNGGILGGHPDMDKKHGIEISTGSLGQGLSIGAGLALGIKKDKGKNKTIVLLGDGELNEGMIWEAVMFSSHHKLDNLICIIDYNNLQGYGTTDSVLNLEPLINRFNSFGWSTFSVDGHNIKKLLSILNNSLDIKDKPTAIIAKTIKGKGVKSMENKLHSHYEVLSKNRYEQIIQDLEN